VGDADLRPGSGAAGSAPERRSRLSLPSPRGANGPAADARPSVRPDRFTP
jgi:hypothetical protein